MHSFIHNNLHFTSGKKIITYGFPSCYLFLFTIVELPRYGRLGRDDYRSTAGETIIAHGVPVTSFVLPLWNCLDMARYGRLGHVNSYFSAGKKIIAYGVRVRQSPPGGPKAPIPWCSKQGHDGNPLISSRKNLFLQDYSRRIIKKDLSVIHSIIISYIIHQYRLYVRPTFVKSVCHTVSNVLAFHVGLYFSSQSEGGPVSWTSRFVTQITRCFVESLNGGFVVQSLKLPACKAGNDG